jgi:hypothetical protein
MGEDCMTKTILALAWIAGWVHVIWFTPTGDGSIVEFLGAVMQRDTEQVDPLVFTVFNLLGVWPLVMLAMLVQDDQGRLKAWPFAFSSMVLGNSALYVYLFFRREQTGAVAPMTPLVRIAESKALAFFLLVSTIALLAYAIVQGSFDAYAQAFETNSFVSFMTVDFFLFSIAFAAILRDDLRRRAMPTGGFSWLYALVPALGAVFYLTVRAPLTDRHG